MSVKVSLLFIVLLVGSVLALLVAHPIFAATDGALAGTSTGDGDISLEIPQLVRISNIGDIIFNPFSGGGDIAKSDDVCVYTNLDSRRYRVRARGSGDDHQFELLETESKQPLMYQVYWSNSVGTGGDQIALQPNVMSEVLDGANIDSSNCSIGGDSANFEIRILESQLMSVTAGEYTGRVTFSILPELD